MDNKNEKTFADLFSTSSEDNDNSVINNEEEMKTVTFDSLLTSSDESNDDTSISFSNLSLVSDGNVKDDTDIFASGSEIVTSMGDSKTSEQELHEEVKEVELREEKVPESVENSFLLNNDSNPFFSDDGVDNNSLVEGAEKINEINNDVSNVDEKVDSLSFDNSNIEDSNRDRGLFDNTDIFSSNLKEDNKEIVENPFFSNEAAQVDDSNSINKLVSEMEDKKNDEVVNSSTTGVSPFFDINNDSGKVFDDALIDSNISFDETKQINSKLDKIELFNTKNFNVKLVKKKITLLSFVTGVISYAFFIFLVLVLVTLLAYVLDIKIRAAKGDYSAPKYNAYVVLTGSMLPEIKVKDVVITKKVETNELEVGDIITFASSDSRFLGTIITHRIIKKNQDKDGNITFQTRGDNNNVADSALVQPNNIYGKVILKIPKLGYLQDFLATQGGWIIVILLPCVTVISYDVVKLTKGLKKRKNKINVIK